MRPLLSAFVLVALGCQAVAADPLAECRQRRDVASKVKACSEIIDGPSYAIELKAEAFRNRGNTRLAAGALADAENDLDAAIMLAPDDEQARASRGEVRLSRGNVNGAIADFDRAIALDPRSAALLIARGHASMVADRLDNAIADFNAALAVAPDSAVALNNRGLAYRKQGNLDRAIADYSAAVQLNPIYALAYANRGYAREAQGRRNDAASDFRRALLINPTLTGARDALKRLGLAEHAAETDALVQQGRLLAERNCGWCHALGSTGSSPNPKAPEFRTLHRRHPLLALRQPMTRGIAAPHDEMPKLPLSDAEIDRIVAYVNSLASAE